MLVLISNSDEAEAFRARIATTQVTTVTEGPQEPWALIQGQLRHRTADFFRVVGRTVSGSDRLLLRQTEPALVGLLVCGPPEDRWVLVNARAEPGLHGACQFSTTVQSTPANYLRLHGGSATEYLENVLEPESADVLYDAMQYDWGQYYDHKTKQVRLVEAHERQEVPEPFAWIRHGVVRTLCETDFSLTADLRTALCALDVLAAGHKAVADQREDLPESSQDADVGLDASDAWTITPHGIVCHDGSREIMWVHTRSDTREVREWVQPLLAMGKPLDIALAFRQGSQGVEVAVSPQSREGLRGRTLLYPYEAIGGVPVTRVAVSAEGGRFWRHEVVLALVEGASAPEEAWLPLSEVAKRVLAPSETSVELRLLMGLLMSRRARVTP